MNDCENKMSKYFFRASAADFKKIPGSPIAYWLNKTVILKFAIGKLLGDLLPVRGGMTTAENDRFVRLWHEISWCSFAFPTSNIKQRWFPYNKGGEYRKWFGNRSWIVDWENEGQIIKQTGRASVRSEELYLKEMIGWTDVTSFSQLGVRYYGTGFLFDASGPAVFPNEEFPYNCILGFLGSKIASIILQALNPTLHVQAGNISDLPWLELDVQYKKIVQDNVEALVNKSRIDWDSYETSWDFTQLPLLAQSIATKQPLKESYAQLRIHWRNTTLEMQKLEIENNRIFIEAYGLQDELTPDVPLEEITLTCNPWYRYGKKCQNQEQEVFPEDADLESRFQADTMKEFISYAVGCMFGRYSLDKPGLILVNQGETLADYLSKVPTPTFTPDEDNIIPILDGDWFSDDIVVRFKQFLKVTFGTEHYDENLVFIEKALDKDIRKYFLKEFYKDHCKRYKKRPIYWLFKSPKGNFSALIYMHRYKSDLVSKLLNDYLRDFKTKLEAHIQQQNHISISPSTSDKDKIKAGKEIEKAKKMLHDLEDYDRNILYPLATQKIEIDLDDGVKVNYVKFGNALDKIQGLEDKEE